jgi:N-hydroxyarylamine O-acetyltransferase
MNVFELDVDGYLARLGFDRGGLARLGPPSAEGLAELQRAHLQRVPYENLDIQLGRATTINPYQSAARIIAGRGGYCYHLNGAFALLLSALGYSVRWHVAGVQMRGESPAPASGNHLGLTVHGLPARGNPDGMWLVDVGLGDGPFAPLPLRAGEFNEGPFRYALAPSTVELLGWRFTHDPAGSFAAVELRADPAVQSDFTQMHEYLSTSPGSSFVRTLAVMRRDERGVDVLRGRVLHRLPTGGFRELTSAEEWYSALADVFGIRLPELGGYERDGLWRRVCAAHDAWQNA